MGIASCHQLEYPVTSPRIYLSPAPSGMHGTREVVQEHHLALMTLEAQARDLPLETKSLDSTIRLGIHKSALLWSHRNAEAIISEVELQVPHFVPDWSLFHVPVRRRSAYVLLVKIQARKL